MRIRYIKTDCDRLTLKFYVREYDVRTYGSGMMIAWHKPEQICKKKGGLIILKQYPECLE